MERIVARKIIGVEGKDDRRFLEALLRILEIIDVQILEFEGKSNFRTQILALKNTPGFSTISICAFIRDADENPPEAAFRSITDALLNAGLTPPDLDQTFTAGNPRVGIFIMPGNGASGAIEDLCLESIKDEDAFDCVNFYFDCLGTIPTNESKAKTLCYLSGKEPYANSLGYGALKGHWDFSNNSFDAIKAFLRNFN
jgi:hypothetical protein